MEIKEIKKIIKRIEFSKKITNYHLFLGLKDNDWDYYYHLDGFFNDLQFSLCISKWRTHEHGKIKLWVDDDKESEFTKYFKLDRITNSENNETIPLKQINNNE